MPQEEDIVAEEEPPQEEEEQEELEDEEDQEEEEEDEELDIPEDIGLLDETRDMFQRTSDEVILTKTEMSRINKAIDRVLEKVKMENAAQATAAVLDKIDDKEILAERLLAQIEKEISMITRAKEKRNQALEREIKANQIANKKDEERIKVLEEQKQKHTQGEEMDENIVYDNKAENE